MTTTATHRAWLVVADTHRAKLLECSPTPTGRCHVEERDAIEQQWEGHEHGRPSPLAGKTGNSYAARHHEAEEDIQRFARQLIEWLTKAVEINDISRMTVFAPPRFVGALRKVCPDRLAGVLDVRVGDLMNLPADALPAHPLIEGLLVRPPK